MSKPTARPTQIYTVCVQQLSLPRPNGGTLDIPAVEYTITAVDPKVAVREAVYRVADENEVPSWKPWLRKICQHTSVTAVEESEVTI